MKRLLFIFFICISFIFHALGSVQVGAEQTSKYISKLKHKKIGLIVNQTSYIHKTHIVDSLLALGIDVSAIFTPEHGFKGTKDAGEEYGDGLYKGIPLISLYGKNKKPSSEQVAKLDMVIYDIQDVGVRFYTYISTLHYMMQVAGETETEVMVLDRPNPNIDYIAGPIIDSAHMSFVGMHAIPVVYGMTVGELATMINEEGWLGPRKNVHLSVVECAGYTRNTPYELPILPSPNLPNQKAIRWYPTLGLFEGTVVSAGRGTSIPFQSWGHPDFIGLPYKFKPSPNTGSQYPKFKDVQCYGRDLSSLPISEIPNFNLMPLIEAYNLSSDKKEFFNNYLQKLIGNQWVQKMIEQGASAAEIEKLWQADIDRFTQLRKRYLRYPE